MQINLPKWSTLINTAFIPIIKNKDRYVIMYGGRGSSKSDCAAKKLIVRCLTEPYFRYILYRRQYNTIKESQFQNIKDIVIEWGLDSLFTFTESPLQIRCINRNRFICRGGDDAKKLKSVKDPTGVWYEEEIPEESDFITITSSIRTTKAAYLQEIFTINPEVEGDYREHWFWQKFFGKKEGDVWSDKYDELSFNDVTNVKLPATLTLAERTVELSYTVHHSTYKDNKWIPDVFIAQLISLANTNEYYFTIYAEGKWGNKSTGGNAYKLFNRAKNVYKTIYNPLIANHLTFDFNVIPYVTLNVHQVVGKRAHQIDEITLKSPDNKTDAACRYYSNKYYNHKAGVFVYGDPAGVHEDTRTEQGHNDFTIIAKELSMFRPSMRYQKSAPPVVPRIGFINAVFNKEVAGVEIIIGESCVNTIADYQFLKEAADGTKHKQKVKDSKTNVSFEKYGHTSDANDYFYCVIYASEFAAWQQGSISRKYSMGKNVSKNSF